MLSKHSLNSLPFATIYNLVNKVSSHHEMRKLFVVRFTRVSSLIANMQSTSGGCVAKLGSFKNQRCGIRLLVVLLNLPRL